MLHFAELRLPGAMLLRMTVLIVRYPSSSLLSAFTASNCSAFRCTHFNTPGDQSDASKHAQLLCGSTNEHLFGSRSGDAPRPPPRYLVRAMYGLSIVR